MTPVAVKGWSKDMMFSLVASKVHSGPISVLPVGLFCQVGWLIVKVLALASPLK